MSFKLAKTQTGNHTTGDSYDSTLHFRKRELRILARDYDVAIKEYLHASAIRATVDRRDDWFRGLETP